MISNKNQLEQLLAEEDELYLSSFNEETAWAMGCRAREIAVLENLPVAIRIARGDQILFQTGLPGSGPDNELWLSGKARVVSHFQHSSLYVARKLEQGHTDVQTKYHLPPDLYRCKGGAVPLRIKDCGVAAILIVSGLKDTEDHKLAVRIIREFLEWNIP